MGQMTHAVMLGVNAGEAPESLGDEGWYALLERYKAGNGPRPDRPHGDTDDYNVIGFWLAVGASGEDGCPDLDKGFPLVGFLDVPQYRKAYERAQKGWDKFAKWAAKQGHEADLHDEVGLVPVSLPTILKGEPDPWAHRQVIVIARDSGQTASQLPVLGRELPAGWSQLARGGRVSGKHDHYPQMVALDLAPEVERAAEALGMLPSAVLAEIVEDGG
ncbi:hypothetical protein WMF38_57690 [Sorangium sp. So ce118]